MLYALYLVVLASASANAASAEVPRVFCGRILADARVLYCYGTDQNPVKRELSFPDVGELQLHGTQDKRELEYDSSGSVRPWLTPRQASAQNALATLRAKREPGLVDECCLKACYISELMNYC